MKIIVNNFEKYNPRKDLKSVPWFRVNSDIPFEPKLHKASISTKWGWIILLSFYAQNRSNPIEFDREYFSDHSGLNFKQIKEMLDFLEQKEMITIDTIEPDRTRSNPIEFDPNETNETNETNERDEVPYSQIGESFNRICGEKFSKLANPSKLSARRKDHLKARWSENPSLEFWEKLFQHLATKCDFDWGGDRDWKPDFDWIIKNDHNYIKILEGRYDQQKPAKNYDLQLI